MTNTFNVTEDRLGRGLGFLIAFAAVTLPASVLGILGYNLSPTDGLRWYIALSAMIIWGFIYVGLGLRINRKQEFLVIERFGKFYRVAFSGIRILCLPHLIDMVVVKPGLGTLEFQDIPISSEPGQEVDFTDGSAPIKGTAYFSIGDPNKRTFAELVDDIIRFSYAYQKPLDRIANVLTEFAREHLQGMTVDEAQVRAKKLPEVLKGTAGTEVKTALEEIGVHLDPERSITVSDIDLPTEIKASRQRSLDAAREADATGKLGQGYANAINFIIEAAKKAGHEISWADAQTIFQNQRALEVAGKAESISFVAPDMASVIKTLSVGSTSQTPKGNT